MTNSSTKETCWKCGSTKIQEKVVGFIDVYQGMGPPCEIEYRCECGEVVGFRAYGYWDPRFQMGNEDRE